MSLNETDKYISERETLRRDLKRHRALKRNTAFLIVIVILAVISIILLVRSNRDYTESTVVSSVKRIVATDSVAVAMGNGVLTYSHDGAFYADESGNPVWNNTFEMTDPMVDICNGTVAFCNRNGTTIYVYDTKGSKCTVTTATPVRLLRVSSTGNVLTVQDEDEVAGVYLYSATGTTIARFYTTMDQWGYPLTMDISPDGHLVMVCYIFASGDALTSRVAFYNFGSVGASSSDNLVSGYNYEDTLIPQVGFLSDAAAYAIGDNRLIFFGGKQIPEESKVITLDSNVLSVMESGETVGLLTYGAGEKPYHLDVYDGLGAVVFASDQKERYSHYLKMPKLILLYNDTDCAIYNMKGDCKYRARFENSALCMNYTGRKNRYLVVRAGNTDVIEIE